jgi:hypothetical protein
VEFQELSEEKTNYRGKTNYEFSRRSADGGSSVGLTRAGWWRLWNFSIGREETWVRGGGLEGECGAESGIVERLEGSE